MSDPKAERGDIWGAVKWVCILLVVLVIAAGAWKAWSVATAPARAVTSTKDAAVETVAKVTGRLDIQLTKQRRFDALSETAFATLTALAQTTPTMKDRALRASYLAGADNRVCTLELPTEGDTITVWVAADNDGFATAKSLGGTADRLIRMAIFAEGDTIGLRSEWNIETKHWLAAWKRTTLKKPIADAAAEARLLEILAAVGTSCAPAE